MTSWKRLVGVVAAVWATLSTGGAAQAMSGDSENLYATSSVNQICTDAQQIVAIPSLSSPAERRA